MICFGKVSAQIKPNVLSLSFFSNSAVPLPLALCSFDTVRWSSFLFIINYKLMVCVLCGVLKFSSSSSSFLLSSSFRLLSFSPIFFFLPYIFVCLFIYLFAICYCRHRRRRCCFFFIPLIVLMSVCVFFLHIN